MKMRPHKNHTNDSARVKDARRDARPSLLIPVLIALTLLRIWLGTLPGYPPDLVTYKIWSLVAGVRGIQTIYDPMSAEHASAVPGGTAWAFGNYDYPPLYAYLLAPLGALYGQAASEPMQHVTDSRTLNLLVKIPPLVFDVLTAGLIGLIVGRFALWGSRGRRAGWLAALFYLVQPAVLFDSGYWGQPDVVFVFFILLSLTLILLRRPAWGWVAAALACLMKPLALPYLPLLALATLLRSGWGKLAVGAICAITTAIILFLPFLVTGRAALVAQRLISDLDLMPLTSVNAHNLWWLLGPWQPSRQPWLGPMSKTMVGLGLFGLAYLYVLWSVWKLERRRGAPADGRGTPDTPSAFLVSQEHWYVAAAAIAFSFFFLTTHMHENHLFAAIPLLVILAYRGRAWMVLALLVGLAAFINMANHDLSLGEAIFDAETARELPGAGGVRMPAAVIAIANVNAVLMAALYVWFVRLSLPVLRSDR